MTYRDVAQSLFPDIQPDKPIGPILPSVFTGTNAELIRAVAPLYLAGSVMDCTFGEGKWWTLYRPDPFVAHDLYTLDGVDYTRLPEADSTYDAVCFDPPYVTSGGAATNDSAAGFRDRYGIDRQFSYGDESELTEEIVAGLRNCLRVSRGFVLVKCMEFVSSRKFNDTPTEIINEARAFGWGLWDRIVHHTGAGPGGHNIFVPVRARRHHSYLLVFRHDVRVQEGARLRRGVSPNDGSRATPVTADYGAPCVSGPPINVDLDRCVAQCPRCDYTFSIIAPDAVCPAHWVDGSGA